MLTYLDRSSPQYCLQGAKGFTSVALTGRRGLTIEPAPRLLPGEVVYDCLLGAPEDGSAVGHRQHAGIHDAFQRRGPFLALPDGCLRPSGDQYYSTGQAYTIHM